MISRDDVDREEPLDPITILVPCKDQKPAFFWDALQSIVNQTSPDWRALVLFEETTPEVLRDQVRSLGDERLRFLSEASGNLAASLNVGLREADTTFVCILLSDDRLTPEAVGTMQAYRRRHPSTDFFHSARRLIGSDGTAVTEILPSRAEVRIEHFARGSPVKHLMCWRRRLSLEIGGLDEDLGVHGCDDYDFPWSMAEAGCRFQAVRECLYEYRRHTEFERLTTSVPLHLQIDTLRRMFAKHRVPEPDFCTFLESAAGSYLIQAHEGRPTGQPVGWAGYGEAGPERKPDFLDRGFRRGRFFPHRVYRLPKGGPDGFQLAKAMVGTSDPGALREILVYGLPPATDEFPEALFFDDDLAWHQQQFGRPAQIAAANVAVGRDWLHCYLLISDIVQRISRHRQFKTRIESVFKGWVRVLLNSVLDYAIDLGVKTIYSARAAHAMRHTDPKRTIQPPLYERIYDGAIQGLYEVEAEDDWWRLDVAANRHRCVRLDKKIEALSPPKTICLFHDVERGRGHRIEDPEFSARIEGPAQAALGRILEAEARAGIHTTYNVVGELWREVTPAILEKGHTCAFHSFDHRIATGDEIVRPTQLDRCRMLDYRVKGYRPPQSKITAELADAHLAHHNVEWFATSRRSLGHEQPFMENGIVKIPVHLDDFDLYRHRLSFPEWESRAFELIENQEVTAIGLHDCYFEHWLPHYDGLLERLVRKGRLVTFDQLAAEVTFAHARWK